jgi:sugar/nucleoside kinase (ribokinase family)
VRAVLATLGDLVEDIVVTLDGPLHRGSDTPSVIQRRRGGSAANVAVTAGPLGHAVRFLGQVGRDRTGDGLVSELVDAGVDTAYIGRRGSTAAIVVLVDDLGERTMLTDRQACTDLDDPQPTWLDGVTTLHVPFYSFTSPPLSETATTLVSWANEREIAVSIDVSSVSVLEAFGLRDARRLVAQCRPAVVFANVDEAEVMGIREAIAGAVTVVKRGPDPALVYQPGGRLDEVPAIELPRTIDTTAAGDAFAAGFLCHRAGEGWRTDPLEACASGHRAAVAVINSRA